MALAKYPNAMKSYISKKLPLETWMTLVTWVFRVGEDIRNAPLKQRRRNRSACQLSSREAATYDSPAAAGRSPRYAKKQRAALKARNNHARVLAWVCVHHVRICDGIFESTSTIKTQPSVRGLWEGAIPRASSGSRRTIINRRFAAERPRPPLS